MDAEGFAAHGMGNPPAPLFGKAEANLAAFRWGMNCGPGAFAAVCNVGLGEARRHLAGFDRKKYTNPLMMFRALDSLGIDWWKVKPVGWPDYGLVRIQWLGPWTEPGVPVRRRYRHTHWVGTYLGRNDRAIFDINAIGSGGWVNVGNWADILVPWLLEACEPEANGEWRVTHGLEVRLGSKVVPV